MKKKILALVCAGTLICGSAFPVSADSVTAGDIVADDALTPERVGEINDALGGVNAGLDEGVAVAFDGNNMTVTLDKSIVQDGAAESVAVSIPLGPDSRTAAAIGINTAAANVTSGQGDAVAAAMGAAAIKDTVVGAIDLSGGNSVAAVTQIAARLAKELQGHMRNYAAGNAANGSKDRITGVQTAFVEISRSSGESTTGGVVTLSLLALNRSGIGINIDADKVGNRSQIVYALHYSKQSGQVEVCPGTVVNGILGFYMSDFSPVAIVVEDVLQEAGEDVASGGNDSGAANNTQQSSGNVPVSPKTADAGVPVVALIAMIGIVGAVICRKKIKA